MARECKKGSQVVVVVSAVNKTTDDLINIANDAITYNLTEKQHAEIVGMGERTSVRLFSATLESLGIKSLFIDPYSELWPIITDSNYMEARIDLDKPKSKTTQNQNIETTGRAEKPV